MLPFVELIMKSEQSDTPHNVRIWSICILYGSAVT